MARLNIYLPDELAEQAREAGVNISAAARAAVESELRASTMSFWLDRLDDLTPIGTDVTHTEALAALDSARDELDW
jgi:post-segregation antitoxin (ccd killing protein)